MKVIKEHIKSKNFKPFYLLYGTEEYLKRLYKEKLRHAILTDDNDMNYSHFEGKNSDPLKIAEIAQTLPFFSEYRLIIVENSGLFKAQSEMADLLKNTASSTIIIFIEHEIDKRNKLFKLLRDQGTVSEMNGLDERNLKLFIASLFDQENKKSTEATISYLIDKVGSDMNLICKEVEKLVSYVYQRDIITMEDIDAVVTTQVTGKIFQMIDAIGSKYAQKALDLYYDLLSVREKPMSILFLITRHFNILLQVKNLQALGQGSAAIAEKVGIPPFSVNKYIGQTRNFSSKRLKEALEYSVDIEEQIKTGRMIEKIGVELFILTFSKSEQ